MVNRELQRDILKMLKKGLLKDTNFTLARISETATLEEAKFSINYLNDLHLIENGDAKPMINRWVVGSDEPFVKPSEILISGRITAKGVDFLEEDGGLSAVLDTVTVKLHADTIRDLIEAKIISNQDISIEEKTSLLKSLKKMPEEAMRQLTQKLIGYGLEQAPSAWGAIVQTLNQ
ncbi:hypothetical protein [Vreelandella sp.]|uniref:hypothetical protein n=1 Tax=Vreelandella sp. TaxID=3137778 RepID=UPI003BAC15AD